MCSLFNLHTNAKLRTIVLPWKKYLKEIDYNNASYNNAIHIGFSIRITTLNEHKV